MYKIILNFLHIRAISGVFLGQLVDLCKLFPYSLRFTPVTPLFYSFYLSNYPMEVLLLLIKSRYFWIFYYFFWLSSHFADSTDILELVPLQLVINSFTSSFSGAFEGSAFITVHTSHYQGLLLLPE
jgi:hypothetical protein